MKRTVIWKPLSYQGIEYLEFDKRNAGIRVESVVIGVDHQSAFRLDYRLKCELNYAVREVSLTDPERGELQMTADGRGNWFDKDGEPIARFNACLDVDISATPFTNTLPINRIDWQPGQMVSLNMVYVLIPDLSVSVARQRYTCLEKTLNGSVYRFESLDSGFAAVLPVDHDGLVLDYPELFARVWSG